MAPTELLARQHMATLERLLAGSRIRLELLIGGQTQAQRRKALQRIAAGESQIIVGTQALVSGSATFKSLGLVVIDEQHRFGVIQRAVLQQGDTEPHVLVMTATPIPRTIAHAVYGDLDQSVIREGPAGRQPVLTYRVAPGQEDSWWDHFRKKLREGRQGYVVVPAVEESKRGLASIASAFEELANGPLEAFRLGLVHGRLKSAEKQAIMEDFRGGKLDALVCTSVIEVGIDVPNATLMTIVDAESFGLAQLHQLRGRVARGAVAGICGAITASGDEAHPRVDSFVASTDGFALAEQDLRLRGPGELVGTRQSGKLAMYLADLGKHPEIVAEARRDALDLYERDPTFADATLTRLKKLVVDRWGETLGLGHVG
jgi:ATP-dependent DNA helicase RecG